MKIILVSGRKRAGKDTFAKLLQDEMLKMGITSEIMSFAQPMKEIISTTLSITEEQLDTFKNDKELIIVRENGLQKVITDFRAVLQQFGTEAMKPWFGDDVWVRLLEKKAKSLNVDYVIVPDFRFKIEAISDTTVRIKNDEVDSVCTDLHASETELNDFNFKYVIDNTGKPDLTPQIKEFMEKLRS